MKCSILLVSPFLSVSTQAFAPSRCTSQVQVPKMNLSPFGSSHHQKEQKHSPASALYARRSILSEDDLAAPPDQKIIDAVESLGGNDVIASDVAAKAGVSLSTTRQSLSSLAALTRSGISVTESGDLLYSFPSSLKVALSTNSLRYRVTNLWLEKVWPNLFWGIRVAFGVFLFISIAVIFSTLLFIQTGGSSDDRDERDNRRGGGMGMGLNPFGYNWGNFIFDVFYPRPYYGYYGRVDAYDRRQVMEAEADPDERAGILEGIFSYIFGEGDPNRTLEAARLREASKVIRKNGGAVTAEQLAPFCDVDDPDELGSSFLVEEGFVLNIVSQLGGEPSVTDDGDIIYLFKELQVSAEQGDEEYDTYSYDNDSEYLEEKNVEFSRNPPVGNAAAIGLGVVNLGGALYLGQALASPSLAGVRLAGMFGLVQTGFPLLLGYAILFNAIPAARYVLNEKRNAEIDKRNSARRKWKTYLDVGSAKIGRKLAAARSMKQTMRRLGKNSSEGVVYDTNNSFDKLAKSKEEADMKRFDDLLGDN